MIGGQKKPIKNIPNLAMGLDTALEAGEILDTEMSDCENYSVDEASIRSSYGYVMFQNGNHTGEHWGIFQFRKSDGTQRLIRQCGNHLEYADTAGNWTDCIMPTSGSPASAITLTERQPTFAMLNDTIIFSNTEEDVMSSTDGITWTLQSTLPKGLVLTNGKNRMLYLMTDSSLIWWSDINLPLTVGATSWEYLDPNNGQNLRGGITTPTGSTLIFKERSFYEVDDVTLGMVAVSPLGEFQLSSHHTLAATENSVMAMGMDGFYEFSGTMKKISGRIKWTGRNNISNFDLCTAVDINSEYHVSMPDADVSTSYNAQEYIVNRNLVRQDSVQPYVITRNKRYFGCYGIELSTTASVRRLRVYAGFSVSTTSGSPAAVNCPFVYLNHLRNDGITQGLNGAVQPGFFITKYFTENASYFAKKFKKFFYELNISQDTTIGIAYRFDPFGQWTDIANPLTTGDIDFLFSDGSIGGFTEGYGFAEAGLKREFIDIENSEKPRGIQFKITTSSINDITFLGLAFIFRAKQKFR